MRKVLKKAISIITLLALFAGLTTGVCGATESSSSTEANTSKIIDFHAHFIPPAYRAALLKYYGLSPDKYPTPEWDVQSQLNFMDSMGINYAFLEISCPPINFGKQAEANVLSRNCNDYGASIVKQYPDRFGLFATLPLPDVTASIAEIAYCMDTLHVDGFSLPTNENGVYLGDPKLELIFAELNRRHAVVTIHPNSPTAIPTGQNELLPDPMMEYIFDTTRTVVNLITKGVVHRYPNIKFIIPHAGAALPLILDRLSMIEDTLSSYTSTSDFDLYGDFASLYFDLAGNPVPTQLEDLMAIVPEDHLLYGSDYPYTPSQTCKTLLTRLKETNKLTEEQRQEIFYKNALTLFPDLTDRLK